MNMDNKNELQSRGLSIALEAAAILGLLFHVVTLLSAWRLLPETIPVHFDFWGQADRFGDRSELFILLVLSIFAFGALTWLSRHPAKMNLAVKIDADSRGPQFYIASNLAKVLKVEVVWLFAMVSFQVIRTADNPAAGLGSFFVPLVVVTLLFTLVGYLFVSRRYQTEAGV